MAVYIRSCQKFLSIECIELRVALSEIFFVSSRHQFTKTIMANFPSYRGKMESAWHACRKFEALGVWGVCLGRMVGALDGGFFGVHSVWSCELESFQMCVGGREHTRVLVCESA